ncbi:hypothetical protein K661_02039 [Piscirickettsia salmonis LF-89 = ATCC VR-1361]|nr:hypothetical protein K661_02039 [Piscirickettsia salmonis LF-89 = ATCC VR-1361]
MFNIYRHNFPLGWKTEKKLKPNQLTPSTPLFSYYLIDPKYLIFYKFFNSLFLNNNNIINSVYII